MLEAIRYGELSLPKAGDKMTYCMSVDVSVPGHQEQGRCLGRLCPSSYNWFLGITKHMPN